MTRGRRLSRWSRDANAEVRAEVAFHLEMRAAQLEAEGLDPVEARARALREFGNDAASCRSLSAAAAARGRRRAVRAIFADALQDAVHGWRLLTRSLGFAGIAVSTLALAIGGNAAVFGVVNALLLQPLDVRDPDAIVRIHPGESTVSWPNIEDLRSRGAEVMSDLVAQASTTVAIDADPFPVRVSAALVSPNYFEVLGVAPLAGRVVGPDDRGRDVIVLGERLWRTRYAASPAIVGRTIALNGRSYVVIGILPRSFRGIAPAGLSRDLWMPIDPEFVHRAIAADRAQRRFEVFGRLRPGVTVEQAHAAMRIVGAQMATEHPAMNERFASLEIFSASGLGLFRGVGKTLLPVFAFIGFLSVITGFVLLIACINLGGLLLGRAEARRSEIAVRLALGASRGRILRQLFTESLLLALFGGAGGLAIAWLATRALSTAASSVTLPIDLQIGLDARVLGYTFAVSAFCAVLFGSAPARRASRQPVAPSLRPDGASDLLRQRVRQGLLIAQVAVSALLLFWSALFTRSLLNAGHVEIGFETSGVLLADIELVDEIGGTAEQADAPFVDLLRRVQDLPGVEAAGWSSIVPLALLGNERFRVSRATDAQDRPGTWIVASRLSPGWFSTVRIPFLAGRDFDWNDRQGTPAVVIVNETLAKQFWGGPAVGARLGYGTRVAEVVGVVRDSKYWTLGEAVSPTVYLPFRQNPSPYPPTLHVRASNARLVSTRLRQIASEVVPKSPIAIRSMDDAVEVATMPAQVGAMATGAFGLLGALLATLGTYGLISFLVVQRSREVAIRRAIGAPASHVVRIVVGGTMALTMTGLVLGIVAGGLTAPLLGGLLIDVSPFDPLVTGGTGLALMLVAALACAPLAMRAIRIDPLALLKAE